MTVSRSASVRRDQRAISPRVRAQPRQCPEAPSTTQTLMQGVFIGWSIEPNISGRRKLSKRLIWLNPTGGAPNYHVFRDRALDGPSVRPGSWFT